MAPLWIIVVCFFSGACYDGSFKPPKDPTDGGTVFIMKGHGTISAKIQHPRIYGNFKKQPMYDDLHLRLYKGFWDLDGDSTFEGENSWNAKFVYRDNEKKNYLRTWQPDKNSARTAESISTILFTRNKTGPLRCKVSEDGSCGVWLQVKVKDLEGWIELWATRGEIHYTRYDTYVGGKIQGTFWAADDKYFWVKGKVDYTLTVPRYSK